MRLHSFNNCRLDSMYSSKEFVQEGFFYSSETALIQCFFCNGCIKNWNYIDNACYMVSKMFIYSKLERT